MRTRNILLLALLGALFLVATITPAEAKTIESKLRRVDEAQSFDELEEFRNY